MHTVLSLKGSCYRAEGVPGDLFGYTGGAAACLAALVQLLLDMQQKAGIQGQQHDLG